MWLTRVWCAPRQLRFPFRRFVSDCAGARASLFEDARVETKQLLRTRQDFTIPAVEDSDELESEERLDAGHHHTALAQQADSRLAPAIGVVLQ